jgi:hypothetical protein
MRDLQRLEDCVPVMRRNRLEERLGNGVVAAIYKLSLLLLWYTIQVRSSGQDEDDI